MSDPRAARCVRYVQNQWLGRERRTGDVVDLARHLVGIQSQLRTTPGLAARARLAGVGPDDVRRELEETRRLVRTWTVRGTLHVVAAEDLPVLWRALRPEWESRWSKYLDKHVTRQQRADAAAACLQVLARGPATRAELLSGVQEILSCREEWLAYLFSSWGGVLKDLAYAGEVVYGPELDGEVRFVRTADWVNLPDADMEPDDALAALLERYLTAYSPARLQDFVHWSGVTVKRAREALARLDGRVAVRDGWLVRADEDAPPDRGPDREGDAARLAGSPVRDEEGDQPDGLPVREAEGDQPDGSPVREAEGDLPDGSPAGEAGGDPPGYGGGGVRLLPKFDPYLLAHAEKFYLEEAHYKAVFRAAADVAAVILSEGRVIGTWTNKGPRVVPELFAPVSDGVAAQLAEEMEAVSAWLRPA